MIRRFVERFALWLLRLTNRSCPLCHCVKVVHASAPACSGRVCHICETPLAANALRTHDGFYRCLKHKQGIV